ncbi:MAG: TonB-dependent receptor, partial [Tsuneonella sp.]
VPYGGSTVFTINTSLALDAGLFDLDRIEVLRGPQGTLYGASSMGGLLKYVPRKPDLTEFQFAGQGGVSFAEHGGTNFNLAAAANAPVVEGKVGVRASGFYTRDGGYIDDLGLGEANVGRGRLYGGRLDALFQATDNLSIRLTGFAQDIHRDGTAQADFLLTGQPVDGEYEQRRSLREPFDQTFRLVSGTVAYDFGAAALTSITSYQRNHVFYRVDGSPLYVPLLNSIGLPVASTAVDGGITTKKVTQEVRLASAPGGTFDWIVGGFYTNEDSVAIVNLVPYLPGMTPFPLDLLTSSLPSTYKEIAGFGDLTVHLSDKFDVTGGLRYAHNSQSYTQNVTGILAPPAPRQDSQEGVVTYLANARYKFSDHASAYARYATGYRPGGPNVVTLDPVTGKPLGDATFDSDSLASYEVGFKGESADRTFAVDLAAYHIDWKDMLVSRFINGFNSYVNSAGAKIDGAELTLTARPSRSFTATGAFAYQDARLSKDSPDLGGLKGDRLPNVPKLTAALNVDYRMAGSGFSPTFGGTLRFVSDRDSNFRGNPSTPQFDLGDYATVDLRAGATFGRINAQLFVHNLFDERGAYSAITTYAAFGGPARVSVLQPRTIGIGVNTSF